VIEATCPAPRRVTLLILAGGSSTRMGVDKAGLVVEGRPLIARPHRALCALAHDLLVAGPSTWGLPGRAVPDPAPGQGPVAGLVAGLSAARTPLVLAVACDMPTVEPALARLLLTRADARPRVDGVVPLHDGRLEPWLAVYRRRAWGPLAAALAAGVRAAHEALGGCTIEVVGEREWRAVDPAGLSFQNCNRPEDVRALAGSAPLR